MIKQIERPPLLVDLIVEKLQEEIICGNIEPESRLTEEKLSQDFNISRTPLRQALFMLEKMGFVQRREGGGWIVPQFDFKKILERFEVRIMVEMFSVIRSSLESRKLFLKKADKILVQMDDARKKKNYKKYRVLDAEFHKNMQLMVPNENILNIYKDSEAHIRWIRQIAISPHLDVNQSYEDHVKIVELLREGDVCRVGNALNNHLNRLLLKIEAEFEKGIHEHGQHKI